MTYTIINFYKFVTIEDLEATAKAHQEFATRHNLIGTIMLASEGINVNLSGSEWGLQAYRDFLNEDPRFADVVWKKSIGEAKPFVRLLVKIKPCIIKFSEGRDPSPEAIKNGKRMSPEELNRIIKERPEDIVLVDTRNWYETDYGTFTGAELLPIKKFTEFQESFIERFKDRRDAKYVFFCTGGIRCEKATPWAEEAGFPNVYQLEGGILDYFKKFGNEGFEGKCFVFDHRWLVDGSLQEAEDLSSNIRIQPKPLRLTSFQQKRQNAQ